MLSSRLIVLMALCCSITLTLATPVPQFINDVFPRLEINDVMTIPRFAKQRDLLVLSLRKAMDMKPNDPMSFYQIAGIHGMPASPWNNVTNETSPYDNVTASNRWMGYCEHGKLVWCTFSDGHASRRLYGISIPPCRQQLIPGMAPAVCPPLGDLHHWSCQANRNKVSSPTPGCLHLRC